tara:strand:+ start:1171 stop:1692 length:522 start_codon:yes stop_codon:yes gene_type:complete
MSIKLEPELDAPIAGMALTHELGARPWQSPPQFPTLEEAADFYLTRIGDDKLMYNVLSVAESGVAIPTIAETLTLAGVMEGKHTIDTAVLVNPIITEYIKGLADTAGIDYMMDAQESYTDMDITESDLNIVEQELLKDGMLTKDVVEDLKEDVTKDIPKKGLMSREPIEEEIQ